MLLDGCDASKYNEVARTAGASVEDACEAACGYRYCHKLSDPVYPTPIYEIAMYLAGFAVLWILRKRIQIAGVLFFMYMIYNGIVRFLIEEIRVNDKYELLGFQWSQAQYISVLFVIIGIIGIVFLYQKNKSIKTS